MATNIHSTIRKIQDLLNQTDLTNIQQFQDLGREYGELCQSYLENCSKVQELLDRKMYIEAEGLADSFNPPLRDQYATLQFPELTTFRQILDLYDLTLPPPIDTATLDALQVARLQNAGIQPLLEEYRKIARSTNRAAKIHLLRQIVPLASENPEWQRTLLTLESEQIEALTKQAQISIENEDYKTLADVQEQLLTAEWQVKPRPEVVAKIARVLRQEYLRAQMELAKELLDGINEFYSSGTEHEQLGKALNEWDSFQQDTTLEIPEDMLSQVDTARQFWQKEQDKRDKDTAFQKALVDLNVALEQNEGLEKLEQRYFQLTRFDRDIPVELRKRLEAHRAARLAIQKRRRLLGFAAVAAVVMLMACAAVVLFKIITDRHLVKSYRSRLEIALQAPLMDEGMAIKKEMEQTHPRLVQNPIIESLMLKLAEQKKLETERHATFVGLLRQIRENIPYYGERVQEITRLMKTAEKTLVGDAQLQEYQMLSSEVQKAHEKYLKEQGKKYDDLFDAMRQEYQQFKVCLQNLDYPACEASVGKVKELVVQAEKLPDVPESVRRNYDYQKVLFQDMPKELQTTMKNQRFQQGIQDMAKILQAEFPDAEEKQDEQRLRVLLEQLEALEVELKAQFDFEEISESSKAIWPNMQSDLAKAKQVWTRLESIKKLYETDYQKLWDATQYQDLKEGVAEYLKKHPYSPYHAQLKVFQQQIDRFERFSQQEYWEQCESRLQAVRREYNLSHQRVQQLLLQLAQECTQKPLNMLAFGNLEFYFTEPVNIRRFAVISYLTEGLSKNLMVNIDAAQRLEGNECEIEFNGQKVTAEVTFPKFFKGRESDFTKIAPHQELILDLQKKFAQTSVEGYWAGDFLKESLYLINPADALCQHHDYYQRALTLHKILQAYLPQSSGSDASLDAEEKALKTLCEQLQAKINKLPFLFAKNWMSASLAFPEQYAEFKRDVRQLYPQFIFLEAERTMKQQEALLNSEVVPAGILMADKGGDVILATFSDKIPENGDLLILEPDARNLTAVAKVTRSGWRRRTPQGQDLLAKGMKPTLCLRFKPRASR